MSFIHQKDESDGKDSFKILFRGARGLRTNLFDILDNDSDVQFITEADLAEYDVASVTADIEETERQGLIKHETKMKDLREWRASHWGQKADELAIETQERFALTPNNVQRAHPRVHATYARPQTHILMHPCTEHTHILNQSLVDHTSTTYHS